LFRGFLVCGLCDRRMQGHWLREAAYYRCRCPDEYAIASKLAHPRNVYLREDQLVEPLDDWLLTTLAPHNLEATIDAMFASQTGDCATYNPTRNSPSSPNATARSATTGLSSTPAPTRTSSPRGWPRPQPNAPPLKPSGEPIIRRPDRG
jgi:hypothetical protein